MSIKFFKFLVLQGIRRMSVPMPAFFILYKSWFIVSAGVVYRNGIYIAFDIPEPAIHLSIAVENGNHTQIMLPA